MTHNVFSRVSAAYPGRTPVKAGSGKRATKPNKKDLLVTLASWQELLTHWAPMPLKSKNAIVRQISEPKASRIKLVMQVFGRRNDRSAVWDAITFLDFISILERAPGTFSRPKKYPKMPRFKFSSRNQGQIDLHPAQAILKNRPWFFTLSSVTKLTF
ncbi:hypothetical protein RND59_17880 [Vibrio ruber]|uniref:hypothetical protein n=1 Tax=Vibrio ruber TaxID=184755 RepID=UPI0028934F79|nr:hypothetical protein [Vibrio ruber]WNJ97986.1 hypothetical protein RND59_17880 [Vibrio ruber]